MQSVSFLFVIFIALVIYGPVLWITWKFYRALARIGEELSEINMVLRQRLPPPSEPRP
jgi:hypothetical protein